MGTSAIYETSKITAKGRLARGEASTTKGEFVFYKDDKECKRIPVELTLTPQSGPDGWVQCEYEAPLVADDASSYKLRYELIADADKQVVQGAEDWVVWPRKGILEAVKWQETNVKATGFKFRVMQNGKATPWGRAQVYEAVGAEAKLEFPLEKGYPYTIIAVAPWEKKKIEPEPEVGRKRKVEAFLNFTAIFVAPEDPSGVGDVFNGRNDALDDDGYVRQFVNLDTTSQGQDGIGSEIVFVVAAEEDRGLAASEQAKRIGKAGVFVHVKVVFGPSGGSLKKSKRENPKTELLAGLELSGLQCVTDRVEYKGKVELKQSDGTGRFKLCLGVAGGDTCEVHIGSTEECKDSVMNFRNWRKIWYELMAPDYMPLETHTIGGASVRDFPLAARDRLVRIAKTFFTVVEFQASHLFGISEAPPGTVMPGSFISEPSRSHVYILTDHSFALTPTGKSWQSAPQSKAPRVVKLKLCDANYFWVAGDPSGSYEAKHNDVANPVINAAGYWVPKASDDGLDCLTNLEWKAEVDIAACTRLPTLQFAPTVAKAAVESATTRSIEVQEILQNRSVTLVFAKTLGLGNVGTTLTKQERAKVDQFMQQVLEPRSLRRHANIVRFRIVGETGNARRDERIRNVESALRDQFAAIARPIDYHPGLDIDGNLREGRLVYARDVDESRSTVETIAFNLPAGSAASPGPADLVGPMSDTKCPITIYFDQKIHSAGLGLAQGGENLVVFSTAAMDSSIDVMLHETAHTLGLTGGVPPAALTQPKTTAEQEPDATYATNGTLGHRYTGHGHSGSHCAFGMTDADKGMSHYNKQSYETPPGSGNYVLRPASNGTCIMFGENDGSGPSLATSLFCPQCSDMLRARDLSSL